MLHSRVSRRAAQAAGDRLEFKVALALGAAVVAAVEVQDAVFEGGLPLALRARHLEPLAATPVNIT